MRWLVGLKLIQFEQQKTTFFHYFSKKFKTNTLKWLEIYNLRIQMMLFYWKILHFGALSSYRINFSVHFLAQYIHIKRIFKSVSYFSLFFWGFFEISKSVMSRIIVINFLKECLIARNLQIFRKKADTVWSAFVWLVPLKILKQYCNEFRTWSSLVQHTRTIRKDKTAISKA